MSDNYLSEYEERINRTPSDQSRWSGKRGESECYALTTETQAILDKYGEKGVSYSDGIPDFSPFSESTVIIDKMSGSRTSSRTKLVDKNNAFGRATSYHYKYNAGNYAQADIATAKSWSEAKKNDREWSPHDVELYRKQNGLTWHECNDQKTMMMIPTRINSEFTHLGGTSESKTKGDMENLIVQATLSEADKPTKDNAFQGILQNTHASTVIRVLSSERSR